MTKGGVMIGITVSRRSGFLKRKPVRVTISAKASPSSVAQDAVATASTMVFHATPQFERETTQARLHIFGANSLSIVAASSVWSAGAVKICPSSVSTGQTVKIAMDAIRMPTLAETNRSPPKRPFSASPSVVISRNATTRAIRRARCRTGVRRACRRQHRATHSSTLARR